MGGNFDRIVDALRRMHEEGGKGSFVIFHADRRRNYYVQFAGERGEALLYGEAVGNANLDAAGKLSGRQKERLRSIGWEEANGRGFGNFHREWQVRTMEDLRDVALDVIRTLLNVYGFSDAGDLDVEMVLG